ncbi:MAG: gliding motility protein RemB [Flavobacterium sp.]
MIKKSFLLFFLLTSFLSLAQSKQSDQFPVFANCESFNGKDLENCFYKQLQNHVFNNFSVPESLTKNNFKGNVSVVFEVDATGKFKVLYVDAIYPELIAESNRVFSLLPQIKPAISNGNVTYSKYSFTISIPLKDPNLNDTKAMRVLQNNIATNKKLTELDSIVYKKFDFPINTSQLNIQFSHSYYAQFDAEMNQMGSNNHTASKPFTYSEVAKYYDFNKEYQSLLLKKRSWVGRKMFNENLVQIKGEDYWLTLNPIFDLRAGKSKPSDFGYTYQNTRGLQFQGELFKELAFSTTIYESQGLFADYYNHYAESLKPSGGNPAIIPGIGIAKEFGEEAYDFPSADAHLTYTPNKFINMELGYGRNFIGDGYRSLLLGDGASPYPFFKFNTTFWKIKYTNVYMWLKDVRPEVTAEGTYASKYMAHHYLSWNISNRFNLGLYESVVWNNSNGRGFDANFVNPIVFYRTVEFNSSSKSGNALLALTSKYKWNNKVNLYGQFLLDEFSLGDMADMNESWKNKYAYQLGVKYFNAFNLKNLLLQAEFNTIRPYVYSHSNAITNYGHNNQSMGHNWGANFREMIGIVRYHKGRYFFDGKLTYGFKGFDLNTTTDTYNYGGDIYKDYDEHRYVDTGAKIGQGNKTTILIADVQGGYLLNPTTNLKLFASVIYRDFNPTTDTKLIHSENTLWFSVGLRSDIFNMYFDY